MEPVEAERVVDGAPGGNGLPSGKIPPTEDLEISEEEMERAALTPRCVIDGYLYADVANLVGPGSAGKTTMHLYEMVCIALGWFVWGMEVACSGWSLFITAEDQRERLVARLREIMRAMDLNDEERAIVRRSVRIWDVTGEETRLVTLIDGCVVLTGLADEIVERFRDDPPVVLAFDPTVSFGASENAVNDNEQGLIRSARRIVRGLGCCVRFLHHTGKEAARNKTMDQYAGRGGSALADGSRMTAVLQPWTSEDTRRPPYGMAPDDESCIAILSRPKVSYAPPNRPLIWIKRTGFAFEHACEIPVSAEEARRTEAAQIERFLTSGLSDGRYYTRKELEDAHQDLSLVRAKIRTAVSRLIAGGRVVNAPLPVDLRHGGRQTFLCPIAHASKFADEEQPA